MFDYYQSIRNWKLHPVILCWKTTFLTSNSGIVSARWIGPKIWSFLTTTNRFEIENYIQIPHIVKQYFWHPIPELHPHVESDPKFGHFWLLPIDPQLKVTSRHLMLENNIFNIQFRNWLRTRIGPKIWSFLTITNRSAIENYIETPHVEKQNFLKPIKINENLTWN